MAVDTAAKRASAINLALPWRTLPLPDGTVGAGDRQAVAFLYSGILADAAAAAPSYTPAGILWRGGKRRRSGGGKFYTLATTEDWIRYLRDIGELPPEAPVEDAPPVPETVAEVDAWEDKLERLHARTEARIDALTKVATATAKAKRAELERKATAMREFDAYLDELARKAEADEDDDLEVLMLAV